MTNMIRLLMRPICQRICYLIFLRVGQVRDHDHDFKLKTGNYHPSISWSTKTH